MKSFKMLGSVAVVMTALMVFAASASATTITGPGGSTTPRIHAVSVESAVAGTKHVVFHNPIATIPCESTFELTIEAHGAGIPASGRITALSFSPCTNGWTVDVNLRGDLLIHGEAGNKGTVTWTNSRFTATRLGLQCVYETGFTDIGTITGGNPAILTLSAKIPINTTLSSGLCGTSPSIWTGKYQTTGEINIDQ